MKALLAAGLAGAAVLALPARASVTGVLPRSMRARGRGREPGRPEEEFLAVIDSMIVLLQAGTPVEKALFLATKGLREAHTDTARGWRDMVTLAHQGGDVAVAWDELARQWDTPAGHDVAAAWRMSARHGCPLAEAMLAAADGIRAMRRQRAGVESAVAGAHATMGVLVVLPLLGMGLGLLLGVDMVSAYVGASGFVTLWPGLLLLWVGRRWAARLVTRALSPEVSAVRP